MDIHWGPTVTNVSDGIVICHSSIVDPNLVKNINKMAETRNITLNYNSNHLACTEQYLLFENGLREVT